MQYAIKTKLIKWVHCFIWCSCKHSLYDVIKQATVYLLNENGHMPAISAAIRVSRGANIALHSKRVFLNGIVIYK